MKIIKAFKIILLAFIALFIVSFPQKINAERSSNLIAVDNLVDGEVTDEDFDDLNPLKVAKKTSGVTVTEDLTTPGGIISRMLVFAFPLAGFILFIMLFWGGFEIVYGASTSKAMEAGKNRITAALIGFFLLFSSYWIIQIIEEVLGITIFL